MPQGPLGPGGVVRVVFAGVVAGQKCKRSVVEASEQVFCRRLLRAIPGGPPTGVQKSAVLHCVEVVSCVLKAYFQCDGLQKSWTLRSFWWSFELRVASQEPERNGCMFS